METYTGDIFTPIEAQEGYVITLPCAGKKSASDISVYLSGSTTLSFNGVEISAPKKVVTLACKGKKLKSDVVIRGYALSRGVRITTADGYVLTDTNGFCITNREE